MGIELTPADLAMLRAKEAIASHTGHSETESANEWAGGLLVCEPCLKAIADTILDAVAVEREACADLAGKCWAEDKATETIQKAIRARGATKTRVHVFTGPFRRQRGAEVSEAEATTAALVDDLLESVVLGGHQRSTSGEHALDCTGCALERLIADLPASVLRYQREHEAMEKALREIVADGTPGSLEEVLSKRNQRAVAIVKIARAALDALKEPQ